MRSVDGFRAWLDGRLANSSDLTKPAYQHVWDYCDTHSKDEGMSWELLQAELDRVMVDCTPHHKDAYQAVYDYCCFDTEIGEGETLLGKPIIAVPVEGMSKELAEQSKVDAEGNEEEVVARG